MKKLQTLIQNALKGKLKRAMMIVGGLVLAEKAEADSRMSDPALNVGANAKFSVQLGRVEPFARAGGKFMASANQLQTDIPPWTPTRPGHTVISGFPNTAFHAGFGTNIHINPNHSLTAGLDFWFANRYSFRKNKMHAGVSSNLGFLPSWMRLYAGYFNGRASALQRVYTTGTGEKEHTNRFGPSRRGFEGALNFDFPLSERLSLIAGLGYSHNTLNNYFHPYPYHHMRTLYAHDFTANVGVRFRWTPEISRNQRIRNWQETPQPGQQRVRHVAPAPRHRALPCPPGQMRRMGNERPPAIFNHPTRR